MNENTRMFMQDHPRIGLCAGWSFYVGVVMLLTGIALTIMWANEWHPLAIMIVGGLWLIAMALFVVFISEFYEREVPHERDG